jgi:predicted nucleic acid-binding protein
VNAYPDTSFVFSLYVKQGHSAAVAAHMTTLREPLPVGQLLQYEISNAIRLAAFQKSISPSTAITALAAFEADMEGGRIVIPPVSWGLVLACTERMSHAHTLRVGHRSFDILHVATAIVLGAKEFLTFDANQRKLATAEGLKVKP